MAGRPSHAAVASIQSRSWFVYATGPGLWQVPPRAPQCHGFPPGNLRAEIFGATPKIHAPAAFVTRAIPPKAPEALAVTHKSERDFGQSQRDCVLQPKVARAAPSRSGGGRHELPWEGRGNLPSTPTGLRPGTETGSHNPVGGETFWPSQPRVARPSPREIRVLPQPPHSATMISRGEQPWASGRNPFGIRRVPLPSCG